MASKYKAYENIPTIKIFADPDEAAGTLELQIAKSNELALLNNIFGTNHGDQHALTDYMLNNKTECALKIFETNAEIRMPNYLQNAVE